MSETIQEKIAEQLVRLPETLARTFVFLGEGNEELTELFVEACFEATLRLVTGMIKDTERSEADKEVAILLGKVCLEVVKRIGENHEFKNVGIVETVHP